MPLVNALIRENFLNNVIDQCTAASNGTKLNYWRVKVVNNLQEKFDFVLQNSILRAVNVMRNYGKK